MASNNLAGAGYQNMWNSGQPIQDNTGDTGYYDNQPTGFLGGEQGYIEDVQTGFLQPYDDMVQQQTSMNNYQNQAQNQVVNNNSYGYTGRFEDYPQQVPEYTQNSGQMNGNQYNNGSNGTGDFSQGGQASAGVEPIAVEPQSFAVDYYDQGVIRDKGYNVTIYRMYINEARYEYIIGYAPSPGMLSFARLSLTNDTRPNSRTPIDIYQNANYPMIVMLWNMMDMTGTACIETRWTQA